MRFAANISRIKSHDFAIAAEIHKLRRIEAQLRTIEQNAALHDSSATQLAQNALAKVSRVRQSAEQRRDLLRDSANELEAMIAREERDHRNLKQQLGRLGIYE